MLTEEAHKINNKEKQAKYRNKNREKIRKSYKIFLQNHPGYKKEHNTKWKKSEKGKKSHAITNARWLKKNGWKMKIYSLVFRAKKLSVLLARNCEVCGELNAYAHHDNYDKPLEVRWFCPKHHIEYHKNKIAPTAKV